MSYWGANILPQRLNKILELSNKDDHLLDFGCGQGAYTYHLKNLDYKIKGSDILKYDQWKNNDFFEQLYKLPLNYPDNLFDVIFCFEVLEHCSDYISLLQELNRICRREFILSVPNCDLDNLLRGANLVPAHWTDQTHCNFFTKKSITEILMSNNFSIVTIEDCLEISVSEFFWKTLKVPNIFRKLGAKITRDFKLSPTFYSSILIHCKKDKKS